MKKLLDKLNDIRFITIVFLSLLPKTIYGLYLTAVNTNLRLKLEIRQMEIRDIKKRNQELDEIIIRRSKGNGSKRILSKDADAGLGYPKNDT